MLRSDGTTKQARLTGLVVLLAVALQPLSLKQKPARIEAQQATPERSDLYKTETFHFSAPPPTVAPWGFKCDGKGDIYVVYGSSLQAVYEPGGISQLPISKLSIESKSVVRYPLPEISDYPHLFRWSFDVSPSGTVYALINTGRKGPDGKIEPVFLIVRYNDDGTMDSDIKIGGEPGERIQPLRLAVFGDGNFLLSGTAAGKEHLGAFAGIFDRDGTFVAPIKLAEAVAPPGTPPGSPPEGEEPASARTPKHPQKGPAGPAAQKPESQPSPVAVESSTLSFSSSDGNIYALQGTGGALLYVVSPAGYIVGQFQLKPPAPGLSPVQMAAAGPGYLFIAYTHIATGAAGENPDERDMVTVLNAQTGRVMAVYRLASADAALPACADSPYDFLFLGTGKDNKLEVVRYAAR